MSKSLVFDVVALLAGLGRSVVLGCIPLVHALGDSSFYHRKCRVMPFRNCTGSVAYVRTEMESWLAASSKAVIDCRLLISRVCAIGFEVSSDHVTEVSARNRRENSATGNTLSPIATTLSLQSIVCRTLHHCSRTQTGAGCCCWSSSISTSTK